MLAKVDRFVVRLSRRSEKRQIGLQDSVTDNPVSQDLAFRGSKLQAQLKCDHSRRAVASQADAEQSCRGRRGVGDRSKSTLRRWLSWNSGQHHTGKRKIRVVEYIEELGIEPQLYALG